VSNQSIQLKGGKAVVVAVLVLGFAGFRMVTARTTLETQGRQELQDWVTMEIRQPLLDDESLSLEEKGQAVLAVGNVEIRSMRARGTMDNLIVRIELEPSGDLPEGTELVRYYRMEYSTITGWRHRGNATAVSYYLKLF